MVEGKAQVGTYNLYTTHRRIKVYQIAFVHDDFVRRNQRLPRPFVADHCGGQRLAHVGQYRQILRGVTLFIRINFQVVRGCPDNDLKYQIQECSRPLTHRA